MKDEDQNEQTRQRREKLSRIRDENITAYPNDFRRNTTIVEILNQYDKLSQEELLADETLLVIAGRLMTKRVMGKASFAHLQDENQKVQLYVQKQLVGEEAYEDFKRYDLGDILGVTGTVFRTKTGELSLRISNIRLLVKSLHPLPDKYHGLVDIETKYRKRYLDLMVNAESREVFRKRSKTINALRKYLDRHNYLEIESPITLPIPGGANARPFITHHNALDMKLYLRIAQELAIKRCLVGGFEKVYELNRNFRNEGLSTQHNPEFTMLEYNEAYVDYIDYMIFTEEMLSQVARDVSGSTKLPYQGSIIDFDTPFERYSLQEVVKKYHPEISDEDIGDAARLGWILSEWNIPHIAGSSAGTLLLDLFESRIEDKLIQPTFITGYPVEASPLSRRCEDDSSIVDRFELFVAGRELANGFSELNDPDDQADRFSDQAKSKIQGDEEAMFFDHDYIQALEYGLPPNAGGGIGVDRLVMILTNMPSIRDVLLFPHMRPDIEDALI
ncbi:MAG: lysine--tRNA ligase [Acidiferrobacteraceae bacterium]|nr:lysine--tRNA ligase [Acidiferrobacteraceae bacterium]